LTKCFEYFVQSFGGLRHSDLSISNITATDSNTYNNLNITKLYTLSDTGKPALPVKNIWLYIPDDEDVDNVSFTTSSAIKYNLIGKVAPVQKPLPTSVYATAPDFIKPDSVIYNSNAAWPTEMVSIVNNGYFDGKNRIIKLEVVPFQYYPLINKLDFYSTIHITVNLKQSNDTTILSVKHRTPYTQAMYSNIMKKLVDNPLEISSKNDNGNFSLMTTTMTLPTYEYVIITDASLISGFANFIEWKKKKGINVGIVTTNDIYNCSDYSAGDVISNPPINDNEGKVRQYLYDAHFNGSPSTTWVLIAGDYNTNVPVKSCSGITTDLYFTDLTGNWSGSHPLSSPDVFVGRLICSNSTDVQNWANKVILYEQNPGYGDNSYLLNAFSIQADQMQEGVPLPYSPPDQAGIVADYFSDFTHTILGETVTGISEYNSNGYIMPSGTVMGTPKGADVISELNNNHYGLISWFCHGGTGPFINSGGMPDGESGISVMTSGINGSPYWKIQAQDAHDYVNAISEQYNGIDNLNNEDYPSVLYSISCTVTPFNITSNNGNNGAMNCGEAFTKLPQTGGVAFLGNTGTGFVSLSYLLYESFASFITSDDYHSHIGVAESMSKYYYGNSTLAYNHNLIGCPETKMWTDIPQNLSVSTSPSSLSFGSNNTVTVTLNNLPVDKHAIVCLYKESDIFLTEELVGTGNPVTATFNNVYPTNNGILNVTVTSHNYLPFLGNIPLSCNFNSTPLVISTYTTWDDLTIINSDISVESGTTLTINNKVYLNQNTTFTVKNGATLIVNASGSILGSCNTDDIWTGNLFFELGSDITIDSW